MYVRPLREIDPPIFPQDCQESFIQDMFHNFLELHAHHRKLLDQLHEIQREEPTIQSITAPLFNAALNLTWNMSLIILSLHTILTTNPLLKSFCDISALLVNWNSWLMDVLLTASDLASWCSSIGYEKFYQSTYAKIVGTNCYSKVSLMRLQRGSRGHSASPWCDQSPWEKNQTWRQVGETKGSTLELQCQPCI